MSFLRIEIFRSVIAWGNNERTDGKGDAGIDVERGTPIAR